MQDEERAEESVEIDWVVRLGRSRAYLAVGVASFAFGCALLVEHVVDPGPLFQPKPALTGPLLALAFGVLMFGIGWEKRVPRAAPMRLSASALGLSLGDARLALREELVAATISCVRRDDVIIHLERPRRLAIDLSMPSLDSARALRRVLGLSAPARQTIPIDSTTLVDVGLTSRVGCLSFLVPAAAAVAVVVWSRLIRNYGPEPGHWASELLRALPFIAPGLLIHWLGRAHATLGADGIELRAFRRRRFIPVHELAAAEVVEIAPGARHGASVVRLLLRSGAVQDLALGSKGWFVTPRARAELEGRAGVFAERVNELIANRASAPDTATFDVASLTRASRPMDAWLASLRAMTLGTDTFRQDVTGRVSALLDLVDDSAARALTRAAAAIALSRSDDPRARLRVAAASASTASPRLRAVLEAVSKGDDDRLRDALAALEAAEDAEDAAAAPRRRPAS